MRFPSLLSAIIHFGLLLRLATVASVAADASEMPLISTPELRARIASLSQSAKQAAAADDLAKAEKFYQQMLSVPAPHEDMREALKEMAELYRGQHARTKAIAVYEQFVEWLPNDPGTPEMLMKLGIVYREAGANQLAIARFYTVLNAVLKTGERELAQTQGLATRAQFEIAETHLRGNDYAQAAKYFSLMTRLDLSREDKAHVAFKSAYCQFLQKDYAAAAARCREFFEEYADTKYAPECHYMLASALKKSGHEKEAMSETLALLRMEKEARKTDPEKWAHWQQQTGNELANDFYAHGDFVSAVTIFQTLAKLNDTPRWRWPVIYQMGLCFEHLGLSQRALEAYKFIADENKKLGAANGSAPGGDGHLGTIVQLAQWHTEQVAWQETTQTEFRKILGAPQTPPEVPLDSPAAGAARQLLKSE